MKTLELKDHALDYAVALAHGWINYPSDTIEQGSVWHEASEGPGHNRTHYVRSYTPNSHRHSYWAEDLIDQFGIATRRTSNGTWYAMLSSDLGDGTHALWSEYHWKGQPATATKPRYVRTSGDTRIEAALRCYVLHKLGLEVDVPEDFEKFWYVPPDDGEPCY